MIRVAQRYGAAPEIETERLRLRAHRSDDLADCIAMWADPLVTRFIGGKPSTPQQTWMRLLGYAGHWATLGFGYWVVEEKRTGLYAGEIGFADFKREIAAEMRDVPELGWALAPRVHGIGYATEAARAVVAWGDRHFTPQRTVCLIDPSNLASIRVAEKCGYEPFRQTVFLERETIFFARSPIPPSL